MKHLIIGGHDGVSFAMCGEQGTGPDFADRQPEDGDCPGCLEVWAEVEAIPKDPFQVFCELMVARWPTGVNISCERLKGGVLQAGCVGVDGQWIVETDGATVRIGFGVKSMGEGSDLDAAMKAWMAVDSSPVVKAICACGCTSGMVGMKFEWKDVLGNDGIVESADKAVRISLWGGACMGSARHWPSPELAVQIARALIAAAEEIQPGVSEVKE